MNYDLGNGLGSVQSETIETAIETLVKEINLAFDGLYVNIKNPHKVRYLSLINQMGMTNRSIRLAAKARDRKLLSFHVKIRNGLRKKLRLEVPPSRFLHQVVSHMYGQRFRLYHARKLLSQGKGVEAYSIYLQVKMNKTTRRYLNTYGVK